MIIRHAVRVTVSELRWGVDPRRVEAVAAWPDDFAPYLRSEEQAVVVDDRFEALLREIVPQRSSPMQDLGAVMDYVGRTFTYDHRNSSLRCSSVHALTHKTGHCSDYHGFCAALGRLSRQYVVQADAGHRLRTGTQVTTSGAGRAHDLCGGGRRGPGRSRSGIRR